MTHLADWQGLSVALLCPEEAEEGLCLSSTGFVTAASGEQKQVWFQISKDGHKTKQHLTHSP